MPTETPTPTPGPVAVQVEMEEPELPVAVSPFSRVRNTLDGIAFEARKRITLVSLLAAVLVLVALFFAYLIRRRR